MKKRIKQGFESYDLVDELRKYAKKHKSVTVASITPRRKRPQPNQTTRFKPLRGVRKNSSPKGMVTFKGTRRKRAWRILLPSVEHVTKSLKEITSLTVHKELLKRGFKFSASEKRQISSVAAALRKLAARGVLRAAGHGENSGHGRKPVRFNLKRKRAA